jgi:glutaredoxin
MKKYYIYTQEGCTRCEQQKKKWDEEGVVYEERSADRLQGGNQSDQIDVDGFVDLCSKNMVLPAIVEREVI